MPSPLPSSTSRSALLLTLLSLGLLCLSGCRQPVQQSEEARIEATLLGEWSFNADKTLSVSQSNDPATKAKAAALDDYLGDDASEETAMALRTLMSEGANPGWLLELAELVKTGKSVEVAMKERPAPSNPYGELTLNFRFEGGRFLVGDGNKGWDYTVSKIDEETGQTIILLGKGADGWAMKVTAGEETMVINTDAAFASKTGVENTSLPAVLILTRKK